MLGLRPFGKCRAPVLHGKYYDLRLAQLSCMRAGAADFNRCVPSLREPPPVPQSGQSSFLIRAVQMGFFAEAGPVQIFVSSHLIPDDFDFSALDDPAYISADEEVPPPPQRLHCYRCCYRSYMSRRLREFVHIHTHQTAAGARSRLHSDGTSATPMRYWAVILGCSPRTEERVWVLGCCRSGSWRAQRCDCALWV